MTTATIHSEANNEPPPLWRLAAFRRTLLVAGLAAFVIALHWDNISAHLYEFEFVLSERLPLEWIEQSRWFVLPFVGFAAGLLASLSPCILPVVPLNLAFIGAHDVSGWAAARLSALFVLGAALALTPLGLAADAAGFLLVEQRGPVLVVVGVTMIVLSMMFAEVIPLPFSGRVNARRAWGPLAAGAAFALVTTPCASPLVGAVLAAAASQGLPGLSVATMGAFAIGYTALVFIAGVLGNRVLQRFRGKTFDAPRAVAAALLLVAGAGFTLTGAAWF